MGAIDWADDLRKEPKIRASFLHVLAADIEANRLRHRKTTNRRRVFLKERNPVTHEKKTIVGGRSAMLTKFARSKHTPQRGPRPTG